MRTCSAALAAEMILDSNIPCVSLAFTPYAGGSTTTFASTDSPHRIYRVVEREAPWGSVMVVELKNNDNYFKSLDWTNYKVEPKFGYVIEGVGTYPTEAFPAYYVWRQSNVSLMAEPGLITRFTCADIITRAADSKIISGAGVVLTGYISESSDEFLCYGETITGASSGATGVIALVDHDYVQLTGVTGTFTVGETAASSHLSIKVSAVTNMGAGGGNTGSYYGVSITSIVQTALQSVVAAATVSTSAPGSDDDDSNCASTPNIPVALGDNVLSLVQNVVGMTKCGMLWRGTAGYLKYLQDSHAG